MLLLYFRIEYEHAIDSLVESGGSADWLAPGKADFTWLVDVQHWDSRKQRWLNCFYYLFNLECFFLLTKTVISIRSFRWQSRVVQQWHAGQHDLPWDITETSEEDVVQRRLKAKGSHHAANTARQPALQVKYYGFNSIQWVFFLFLLTQLSFKFASLHLLICLFVHKIFFNWSAHKI